MTAVFSIRHRHSPVIGQNWNIKLKKARCKKMFVNWVRLFYFPTLMLAYTHAHFQRRESVLALFTQVTTKFSVTTVDSLEKLSWKVKGIVH